MGHIPFSFEDTLHVKTGREEAREKVRGGDKGRKKMSGWKEGKVGKGA